MLISFSLVSLLACKGPPDEPPKTIYVDGELYSLDLQVITPRDQIIDQLGRINQLNLVVRQSNGETSSHTLSGSYAEGNADNRVIPPLDGAQISLIGSEDNKIVFHGTSAPVTLTEGELAVPLFVAKNDTIGRLGKLTSPAAFAPLIAIGDGRYYSFGGTEDGIFGSESSTIISRFNLAEPNPTLTPISLTATLPSQPNGSGWVTQSGNTIGGNSDKAGQVLLAGGGPVFPTIDDLTLSNVFPSENAYRFDPLTETILEAGAMNHARFDHRSAVLPSGEVVVTGGFGSTGEPIGSIDIYSPNTDEWATRSQELSSGAVFHAMAQYQDDGILVCGGLTAEDTPQYSDQCNLIKTTHEIETAQPMDQALLFTNLITLADGRVLRTGGLDATDLEHTTFRPDDMRATSQAAIFYQGEWQNVGQMKNARAMHSTTLLPGGRVLIVGGVSGISSTHTSREEDYNGLLYDHAEALACVEIFDPETETFIAVDACLEMKPEGTLPQRTLLPAVATDPTYGALISGGVGTDLGASVDSAQVFHPSYSFTN